MRLLQRWQRMGGSHRSCQRQRLFRAGEDAALGAKAHSGQHSNRRKPRAADP